MKHILVVILVILVLLLPACDGSQPPTPPPPPPYHLSTSVSPSGSGSISLNPSGGVYDEGTNVILTAQAASGYVFDHWSGDASGTSSTTPITMNSDKSVTAYFTQTTHTLSTSVSPSGSGSVNPSSGNYEAGSTVTVTAHPASGYEFDYWSGDASGTSPTTTITMNSDKSVTAHFVKKCHEEVVGTTHDNPIGGGSFWYADEYIQGGKSVSLSWEADGTINAHILTETQFNEFKPMGIASRSVASDSGYSGRISAEIRNADRYYFVIYNPIYFTVHKVYSAEAKITWCD